MSGVERRRKNKEKNIYALPPRVTSDDGDDEPFVVEKRCIPKIYDNDDDTVLFIGRTQGVRRTVVTTICIILSRRVRVDIIILSNYCYLPPIVFFFYSLTIFLFFFFQPTPFTV